jgi:chemotaxis signal transduction protein
MTSTTNEADQTGLAALRFRLGEQHYALAITEVLEVAALVALSRLPGTDPAFLGVANRHGSALPILDLRRVFDCAEQVLDFSTVFIVALYEGHAMGLVVDEVVQVMDLPVQNTLTTQHQSPFIQRVVPLKDDLIQVLALPAIFSRYFQQPDLHDEGLQLS